MKRKILKAIGLVFFLLLAFTGCGSTSAVSETASVGPKAKTGEDIYVAMKFKFEGIDGSEASWLMSPISEQLEIQLGKYTNYKFLNRTNLKDLFEIQGLATGLAFDQENSSIETQKMKSEHKELFVTVRKEAEGYILSARFTDTSTTENDGMALSSYKNTKEALYSKPGNAVNEITVSLCEQLGFTIPEQQKLLMLKGETDLEIEDKQSLYDENIALYKLELQEIEENLTKVASSTDVGAEALERKLRAEKVSAEKRLMLEEENKKRVAEEILKRQNDEAEDNARTAEQKQRILNTRNEINEKYSLLSKQSFENNSVLSQIDEIELKKAAALDIYSFITTEAFSMKEDTKNEIFTKKNEIRNMPYSDGEYTPDGKIAERAIKQREKIIVQETNKIIERKQHDINIIAAELGKQKDSLLKEIENDSMHLSTCRISTLGDELKVYYGPYDGDRKGWNLSVTVKSDGVVLLNTTAFLYFEALTGKNPDIYANDNYLQYMDDVDFYSSLFMRGDPYLVFTLDYYATPMDNDKPSTYKFNFKNFSFYDTDSLRVSGGKYSSRLHSGHIELDENSLEKEFSPSYDIRPLYEPLPSMEDLMSDLSVTNLAKKVGFGDCVINEEGDVLLGAWPQSVKEDNVTIDENLKEIVNGWQCYIGSDEYLYVKKIAENSGKFSNGKKFKKGQPYYFKLEPIKWTCIVDNYNYYNANVILLSKDILTIRPFFEGETKSTRRSTSYVNSSIRAYLNGLDGTSYGVEDFTGKGFINLAFDQNLIDTILVTEIDSTFGFDDPENYNKTNDKIFLMSRRAVENNFRQSIYDEPGIRSKKPCDYAMTMNPSLGDKLNWLKMDAETATYLILEGKQEENRCPWWTRTPGDFIKEIIICDTTGLSKNGEYSNAKKYNSEGVGVVPALRFTLSLSEN